MDAKNGWQPMGYMTFLSIQVGMQPILMQAFTSSKINRLTVVLGQEICKGLVAFSLLTLSGKRKEALKGWTITSWLRTAGIPAVIYAIQGRCILEAVAHLDPFTFNVLIQTKTLSAAFCCWILMGKPQSLVQVFALFLLALAALIMEGFVHIHTWMANNSSMFVGRTLKETNNTDTTSLRRLIRVKKEEVTMAMQSPGSFPKLLALAPFVIGSVLYALRRKPHYKPSLTGKTLVIPLLVFQVIWPYWIWDLLVQPFIVLAQEVWENLPTSTRLWHGVIPVLLASFSSGLAGAICQRNLQFNDRNSLLFSLELCVASGFFVILSLLGTTKANDQLWSEWRLRTLIPILSNGIGGVLVGLVTKHAGSVRKGFALVLGMFCSGLVQSALLETTVESNQIIGGLIAGMALYIHAHGD